MRYTTKTIHNQRQHTAHTHTELGAAGHANGEYQAGLSLIHYKLDWRSGSGTGFAMSPERKYTNTTHMNIHFHASDHQHVCSGGGNKIQGTNGNKTLG